MASLIPFYITAFDKGFINNKKPFLIPDEAFAVLENAVVFRDRVLKREGNKLLGRLRRNFTVPVAIGNISAVGAGTFNFNIFTGIPLVGQPNAEIELGSITPITITIAAPINQILTDLTGTGVFVIAGAGPIIAANINYATGDLILTFSAAAAASAATFMGAYYPGLPVMGIVRRDVPSINDEQTIWFDEIYAYKRSAGLFLEFITTAPNTWASTDSDFFWGFNYRGPAPQDKLLFVTNFVSTAANPMRYTDGLTWTNFAPLFTALNTIFSARIIVSYYGRLIFLNTWEGTTAGGAGAAVNIQNRCRFSGPAFGDPTAVDAFRTDIFGLGGVIDAPTAEAIIGAMFIKNTLIVLFEQTTWQLTYVGEYGLPFVWERISVDFGSESTFSTVIYENQVLAIGDKAIIAANAIGAQRIDLDIPDQIFSFKNTNDGVKRVYGIRDYQKEFIYWNYPDAFTWAGGTPPTQLKFPNKVLVYNYRNNSWAIFRDSVTAFGLYQLESEDAVTWNSITVTWDDPVVTWDDPETESLFPAIVIGNQQGFVHAYGYELPDEPSLSITNINLTVSPIIITSPNHNLDYGEIIRITGLEFIDTVTHLPKATDLNLKLYRVNPLNANTFEISRWDFASQTYQSGFAFTPSAANTQYVGAGQIALMPRLNVQTKDINVFSDKGMNIKLAHLDFLVAPFDGSAFSVIVAMNSSVGLEPSVVGNLLTGNTEVSTSTDQPFYTPGVDYAWFRFFATCNGQFFRINMTFDDDLMNTYSTHSYLWTLFAITAYVRPGGRNLFT